jgi:hypothetical protein
MQARLRSRPNRCDGEAHERGEEPIRRILRLADRRAAELLPASNAGNRFASGCDGSQIGR